MRAVVIFLKMQSPPTSESRRNRQAFIVAAFFFFIALGCKTPHRPASVRSTQDKVNVEIFPSTNALNQICFEGRWQLLTKRPNGEGEEMLSFPRICIDENDYLLHVVCWGLSAPLAWRNELLKPGETGVELALQIKNKPTRRIIYTVKHKSNEAGETGDGIQEFTGSIVLDKPPGTTH